MEQIKIISEEETHQRLINGIIQQILDDNKTHGVNIEYLNAIDEIYPHRIINNIGCMNVGSVEFNTAKEAYHFMLGIKQGIEIGKCCGISIINERIKNNF